MKEHLIPSAIVADYAREKSVDAGFSLADWREYLAHYAWDTDSWHAYALQCWQQGLLEEAAEACGKAIEIAHRHHPIIHFDHSAICLQLALCAFKQQDEATAQAYLKDAIFQDHQNASALWLRQHGWRDNADIPAYESPVRLIRDKEAEIQRKSAHVIWLAENAFMHDEAVQLMQAGNTDKAMQRFAAQINEEQALASTYVHCSYVWMQQGQHEQAMEDALLALQRHSIIHKRYHYGASLHYLHRGMIHAELKETELAYMDSIRAADIDVTHCAAQEFLRRMKQEIYAA